MNLDIKVSDALPPDAFIVSAGDNVVVMYGGRLYDIPREVWNMRMAEWRSRVLARNAQDHSTVKP